MKLLSILCAILFMLSGNKATAQDAPTSGCGLFHPTTISQNFKGCVNMTTALYENSPVYSGQEFTTARKYTIQGIYSVVLDSSEHTNDSIVLNKANLQPGQIITVLTTAATNDTLTVIHDGYFQGATATALVGAATTASYKILHIYVDQNNNYWKY